MKRTGRPRREIPRRRLNLTLDEPDGVLLDAYAQELGRSSAHAAASIVQETLQAARAPDGAVNRDGVEAVLRHIRGERRKGLRDPRWTWPIEAILADRPWLARWLPELNELLGRGLVPKDAHPDYDPSGRRIDPSPILDRRGYSDLMEFLFPTVTTPRGTVSWSSPEYAQVAAPKGAGEADPDLRHVWESVIRHVVRALAALEKASEPEADPVMAILTLDHIRGPWLRALDALTGEDEPDALPGKRLAR